MPPLDNTLIEPVEHGRRNTKRAQRGQLHELTQDRVDGDRTRFRTQTAELVRAITTEERVEPFGYIDAESCNDRRAGLVLPAAQRGADEPC